MASTAVCGRFDGLSGEFRRRDVGEDVGTRSLQTDHLPIHGRIGGLGGHFGHRRDLAGHAVLQALDVIPAVILVLVADGDLAVWFMLEQVFGLNLTFCLVAWLPSHCPEETPRASKIRRIGINLHQCANSCPGKRAGELIISLSTPPSPIMLTRRRLGRVRGATKIFLKA
jgi:hypothetical protein